MAYYHNMTFYKYLRSEHGFIKEILPATWQVKKASQNFTYLVTDSLTKKITKYGSKSYLIDRGFSLLGGCKNSSKPYLLYSELSLFQLKMSYSNSKQL